MRNSGENSGNFPRHLPFPSYCHPESFWIGQQEDSPPLATCGHPPSCSLLHTEQKAAPQLLTRRGAQAQVQLYA